MKPLLLHSFGTSLRVNGRTLEIDRRSEGKRESYRPQHLPFDSVVVDSKIRASQLRGAYYLLTVELNLT